MRRLLVAIDQKVVELVDLLHKPAGEFAPRARRILQELVDIVFRLIDRDDDPTNPRIQNPAPTVMFSAPKPPPVPRKRQETMEIDLNDLEWLELTDKRKR